MKNFKTKRLVVIAMLCALSYISVLVIRIPIVPSDFLKFEPKDAIIATAGFIYGPLASIAISVIVSFLEMFTISNTGVIGLLMNILSSCAFSCTAAVLYRRFRSIKGAAAGLTLGCVIMTVVMLLWNYTMTPIYMGVPKSAVLAMFPTVFIPFNLLKGTINSALTLLLYKPCITALRKAKLADPSKSETRKELNKETVLIALAILATCVFVIIMTKII